MRLPDFLVIGGMKCGSTTLYRDLLGHPEIGIPEKELNALTVDNISLRDYASYFETTNFETTNKPICGDVSTTYSMLPDHVGVAERAAKFLGRQTQIIYLVREPVSRAISHHRHMNAWHGPGKMTDDMDASVREHASLIDYSRYAMQLEPWRDAFGDESINVVVFEEYVANRRETIKRLLQRLGLTSTTDHVQDEKAFNQSDGKTVLNPFWLAVWNTPIYQRLVRPLMSIDFRASVRGNVLPSAPDEPEPPCGMTVDHIIEQVRDEELGLRQFLKRDEPIWDFEEVRSRFAAPSLRKVA